MTTRSLSHNRWHHPILRFLRKEVVLGTVDDWLRRIWFTIVVNILDVDLVKQLLFEVFSFHGERHRRGRLRSRWFFRVYAICSLDLRLFENLLKVLSTRFPERIKLSCIWGHERVERRSLRNVFLVIRIRGCWHLSQHSHTSGQLSILLVQSFHRDLTNLVHLRLVDDSSFMIDGPNSHVFRRVIVSQRCHSIKSCDVRLLFRWSQHFLGLHLVNRGLSLVELGRIILQLLLDLFCGLLIHEDVLFHLLEVNFIVEIDDVISLTRILVDNALGVDLGNVLLALEEISILVNNVVESNLSQLADFGNRVDCTHNQLVKMTIH